MAYPGTAVLKTFMGISGSSEDGNLGYAINAAVQACEKYTGRRFVAASETRTYPAQKPYVTQRGMWLTTFADFISVTTLKNADDETITADDYDLFPSTPPYNQIRLNPLSGFWLDAGTGSLVTLTASFGYSSDTPDDILYALLRLGKHFFDASKQGVGGAVGGVGRQSGLSVLPQGWPEDVTAIFDTYKRRRI